MKLALKLALNQHEMSVRYWGCEHNSMSTRTATPPPDRRERRNDSSAMTLLSPRSMQARHLRAIAAEATLYGWEDAVASREELIRGIERIYPLSWPHGGLNE